MNPFLDEILRHDHDRAAAEIAVDAIEAALDAAKVALKKEERREFLAALECAAVALNEAKTALDAGRNRNADTEAAYYAYERAQQALWEAEEI